jgi:hypothetical protein
MRDLLGVLGALIAIGEPIRQALIVPEISAGSEVEVSSPFSVPFNIKNASWLFAMSNAGMNCLLDKVVTPPVTFKSVLLKSHTATIKAGGDGAFRCELGPAPNNIVRITPFSLESAHMFLSMHYEILWIIPRNSTPIEFTWYTGASPPRWIRGAVAN